jgi:hypothetical protein
MTSYKECNHEWVGHDTEDYLEYVNSSSSETERRLNQNKAINTILRKLDMANAEGETK